MLNIVYVYNNNGHLFLNLIPFFVSQDNIVIVFLSIPIEFQKFQKCYVEYNSGWYVANIQLYDIKPRVIQNIISSITSYVPFTIKRQNILTVY